MARQFVLEIVCFLAALFVKESFTIDPDSGPEICVTPDGWEGECIDIRQCPSLMELEQNPNRQENETIFLQQSECNRVNDIVYVCCRFQGSVLLPDTAHCGQSFENRIYGSSVTHINEHPWTVVVKLQTTEWESTCAGSLINNRYVLTAAHCMLDDDLADNVKEIIRLGEWNRTTDPDCETLKNGATYCADPYVDIGIEEWITHPDYINYDRYAVNDIALVRLDRYVNFTDFIKPVCLPVQPRLRSKTFVGVSMYVIGWGTTETTPNDLALVKRKATVDGVDLDKCREIYSNYDVNLLNSQICAGGKFAADQCEGDSGGPLVSQESVDYRNAYVLVGIISFNTKPCGLDPGVYTRVGAYIDWILDNLKP